MLMSLLFSPETTIVSLLLTFALCIVLVTIIPTSYNNFFRSASLAITFIPLFWSLWLWILYDSSGQPFQCVCNISSLHLSFGIDAAGLSLVILTAAIFPLCVLLMRTFTGVLTFLLLELVILGSLLVLDLLGFYILFEASLILLFVLIARSSGLGWRTTIETIQDSTSKQSRYNIRPLIGPDFSTMDAAYKIVLYTMVGSLIFLPVIFILYSQYGTTSLLLLTCSNDSILSSDRQLILGFGLFCVFAVKMPLIPVHIWLPQLKGDIDYIYL